MFGINVDVGQMKQMVSNERENLFQLSARQPVLLVFLRHFGCTFCREALADISRQKERIEGMGSKLVFVHMADDDLAEKYFDRYGLTGVTHISDPDCNYYSAFGLVKGSFTQLFGLKSWIRGFSASVVDGHGVGSQMGDGFQMPGVFVIVDGEIKEAFIHQLASDRPDYEGLVKSCCEVV